MITIPLGCTVIDLGRTVTDLGRTEICVSQVDGRPRLRARSGLLRAQQVRSPDGWTKIGLIASTALLLGGDQVELRVDVGPGARLWLFEVAGTVAYPGRGLSASWRVNVRVAEDAQLIMAAEPFVVAAGAEVDRSFSLDVEGSGAALVRETLVLGRSGEVGGRLRNQTSIRRDGALVAREDQRLDPVTRRLPGVLGDERVVDSVSEFPAGASGPSVVGATRFALADGAGTVTRWIGSELASSPLHAAWSERALFSTRHSISCGRDRRGRQHPG